MNYNLLLSELLRRHYPTLITDNKSVDMRKVIDLLGSSYEALLTEIIYRKLLKTIRAKNEMTIAISDRISLDKVKANVASYYGITVDNLSDYSKSKSLVEGRHMAMYLCHELTDHSLTEIGTAFGDRDHSTVLHAIDKIKRLLISNSKVNKDYNLLLTSLRG